MSEEISALVKRIQDEAFQRGYETARREFMKASGLNKTPHRVRNNSLRSKVLQYIRDHPGHTRAELCQLFDINIGQSGPIESLRRSGMISQDDEGRYRAIADLSERSDVQAALKEAS